MFGWLRKLAGDGPSGRKREELSPEARYEVKLTDGVVILDYPGQTQVRAALHDVVEVLIETNDSGPWGADFWWLLLGGRGETLMAFPEGATGDEGVVEALKALPGFDFERLIEAVQCTINGEFVVWRRQ